MTSFTSIEEQLKAEYGAVKGWVMTHTYLSLAAVGVVLWVLGRLHLPF